MELGAFYQEALATHLREELHFKTQEQERGFVTQGVPEELCQTFSNRRKQILQALETAGEDGAVAATISVPVAGTLPMH